ncbi:non-functional pseudokinase ZED1 isoform X3 [Populus trichocarpa]|uniref:Protein kinase domain-containing protein n=1 Tax=Populus trichocarpa TaxID=3694 RepID=A0A3N7EYD8_POPTR|nr:non-functional pseudokinase ZED1 isoform X3 [Populus trichocarpa]|eukprot:XP_024457541.1 non-functional pseudokinase ZED1 isoform X4 [Populus trichocarpa]
MAAERKRLFITNGSLLQEKLISSSNGRYYPFHNFSIEELEKATNNYAPHCFLSYNLLGTWYKGSLDGRVLSICIPRYPNVQASRNQIINEIVNDVAIAAQLSRQRNFLRLIGCCLETPVPLLVYESVKRGNVSEQIHVTGEFHSQPMTWKCRLKIAREIAHAVSYLHTAFSRPIVHRGGGINEQQQWQAAVELALKCLETSKDKRPAMEEVTKILWQIERSLATFPERHSSVYDDGRIFMEEMIASYEGRCHVLQSFSGEELKKMTNNYHPDYIFCCSNIGIWYKGNTENGNISMYKISNVNWCEHVKNEFKFAAELSSHKNVLKLLGYCLETSIPTLVYESTGNGTLFDEIHFHPAPFSFHIRLVIARQIADLVAYLHTELSIPIISKNIKSANIFLDKHHIPKLSNFSQSVQIIDGEAFPTNQIEGTKGYMSPEYITEGIVTQEFDVYNFGVLLFELLIGLRLFDLFHLVDKEGGLLLDHLQNFVKWHSINEVVDPKIPKNEEGHDEQQKWEVVLELAFRCMVTAKEERPKMVEVATELNKL